MSAREPGPRDPLICGAVRTPVGRHGGALAGVRADDLLALAISELVRRTGIPADRIEDVILGCAMPEAEQGLNVARIGLLRAGLPYTVAGYTPNHPQLDPEDVRGWTPRYGPLSPTMAGPICGSLDWI